MKWIDTPLPFEPFASRVRRIEVGLNSESQTSRELLSAIPHKKVMIRLEQHFFRYACGRPNAFETGNTASSLPGTVHAARVELNHSVCIRQSTVADAVIERIELDDVHTRDDGIENICPAGNHRVRSFDRCLRTPVLETIAVSGGDHEWNRSTSRMNRRRFSASRDRQRHRDSSSRAGYHEVAPIDSLSHSCGDEGDLP